MRLSLISCLFIFMANASAFAQEVVPAVPLRAEAEGWIGLPIYLDPVIAVPQSETRVDPRLDELWQKALARPEVETRMSAVSAFAEAVIYGMKPSPAAAAKLRELAVGDPQTVVRIEAINTLIAADDREAGALLVAHLKDEKREQAILQMDKALAAWETAGAFEAWAQRVSDPAATLTLRRSAAVSLGQTAPRSSAGAAALIAVATSADEPAPLRMDAAAAVGRMNALAVPDTLEDLAGGTTVDRLVAVRMLPGLTGEGVEALARQLLRDEDGAVVAEAVASLGKLGGELTDEDLRLLAKHTDERARYETVLRMAAQGGDTEGALLVERLGDPSVRIRFTAMQALLAHHDAPATAPAHREVIERAVAEVLASSSVGWRALEQAALLAGRFDVEGSAKALTGLLWHERPEVRLASADALRRIESPEALPEMLRRAEELTAAAEKLIAGAMAMAQAPSPPPPTTDGTAPTANNLTLIDQETTQLFMAFGAMRYAEADGLMRRYIPKRSGFGALSRGSAVDSLGRLHEGQAEAQPELVKQLIGRVMDRDEMNPELMEVQRFGAIALARMNATSELPRLRSAATDKMLGGTEMAAASRWAVWRISGQKVEEPPMTPYDRRGWFLEPIN